MRYLIYIMIIALLFLAPVQRVDVAKLLPIQAVAVYLDGESVVLETDTEDRGRGENASRALNALKENTPAVVYLDTAEYLLVAQNAVTCVDELRPYLKPSVKVCVCDAAGSVKDAAKYLDVHADLPELRHWNTAEYLSEKK